MKREVDQRKTRKALRKLRRAADRATEEGGPGLSDWEQDFVEGVTTRLEKYGSAFRDPGKGRLEEALSARQSQIARVIEENGVALAPEDRDLIVALGEGSPGRTLTLAESGGADARGHHQNASVLSRPVTDTSISIL